jgi:capsular polysaccharide biosynthesis protein
MSNGAAVETVLRDAGFTITDAGTLPFVDQVRMFQSAQTIFAVLGSGLTGLIYSRNYIKVLAAGPSCWNDRFFHALAQHRRAVWAEIRGPSRWDGNGLNRDAPFEVPIADLRHAIDLLDAMV